VKFLKLYSKETGNKKHQWYQTHGKKGLWGMGGGGKKTLNLFWPIFFKKRG